MEYLEWEIFEFKEENKNILNIDYENRVGKVKIICNKKMTININKMNIKLFHF